MFRIHFFILAVLILKALNLLCEAEDKSYIKRIGSAHGWDVLFYIFGFLKGITLFMLIVLIGTGWSFLKPYLQDKEKKVLMIVIPLQVVANIAQVANKFGLKFFFFFFFCWATNCAQSLNGARGSRLGRVWALEKKPGTLNELGPGHGSCPAGRVRVWKNPVRTRPVAIPI